MVSGQSKGTDLILDAAAAPEVARRRRSDAERQISSPDESPYDLDDALDITGRAFRITRHDGETKTSPAAGPRAAKEAGQPAAATTQIGHNVIAALIFLIFDTLLSLLSILRPAHAVTLLVRSGIATCLLAVFIAFAAHVPGPRVFTPGYHLWGTVFETGDGLVAGAAQPHHEGEH
ncbi:hypothetical protein ACHAPW_006462 [Verticillium nonalfalfae]